MKITHLDHAQFPPVTGQDTVLILGYFDGLHRGHQALFERARQVADDLGLTVSLLTYYESPKLAFERFRPDLLLHLSTSQERIKRIESFGVDQLYLMDFTADYANQSPEEFVDHYVKPLGARVLVAGFDYHFGKGRAGVEELTHLFEGQVCVIDEVQEQGEKISSTRIRQALVDGDVALANHLLGYSFTTDGIVVHGDARGRTIGFPTANLADFERVYIPADGVYVADVEVDGVRYRSMTSVGKNVTFEGQELRIESHLLDFHRDIYGQRIRIFWLDRIRDMVKFDSVDDLMKQLEQDQAYAKDWQA